MKIYNILKKSNDTIVWLFGSGLIGESIGIALEGKFTYKSVNIKVLWGAYDQIDSTVKEIIENTKLLSKDKSETKVTIVWAAGVSGFYSKVEETDVEYLFFQRLINLLTTKSNNFVFNFIFFSSAGALYEGMTGIDYNTDICINRPYGELKLNQERYLQQSNKISSLLILRPSSVYGFIDNRVKRPSLIPTIMHNALLNKLSTLYGDLYTLRNYIWVEDVANFVINKLIHFEDGMYILAGSRSHSIIEIKKEIERVVRKRVYFKLNSSIENNLDIVFSNNLFPWKYTNTTILDGIYKISQKWNY